MVQIMQADPPRAAVLQRRVDIHWPTPPDRPEGADIEVWREKVKALLVREQAVLIAHYYVDPEIQRLAEETGGIVADSLEMARFGAKHAAQTLVVAGVRFMGETAKILSPEKRILMPDLKAECSLDLSCPAEEFTAFCDAHPDRTVVVYANTSAAVKARADWVVTSSIAVKVIDYLDGLGKKIIWAPDRFLGDYVKRQTDADVLLWDGACVVHEEFKANALRQLKQQHPEAAVLVHPESPEDVIALADAVGSTSQLIKAAQTLPHKMMIVATEQGIFYKMQQAVPDKTLIAAPTGGTGATCRSCAHCPWMGMNTLYNLTHCLEHAGLTTQNEILLDRDLCTRAMVPLQRMLDFNAGGEMMQGAVQGVAQEGRSMISQEAIEAAVRQALAEDIGSGDITAQLIDATALGSATLITREDMCLCGQQWFDAVFAQLDARVHIAWQHADGDWVAAGETLCTLHGPARALLTGERCAMNFVQMLSGTATVTRRYAQWLAGSETKLLDTRKTIPGHRLAQKYAVRCGGGTNHRIGLYDAFLVKENHIAAAGGIAAAISRARDIAPGKPVEVEVETLAQLGEAIAQGADIVMLDNFDNAMLSEAVQINRSRVKLEVSGNVDEARLKALARTGVDFVSVGALTKHIQAIDLSMRFTDAIKKT